MQNDLFYQIKDRLRIIWRDNKGNYITTCPQCGKESSRKESHFSFNHSGFHCFVCGFSGGLRKLAEYLSLDIGSYIPYIKPQRPPKPVIERQWQKDSKPYLTSLKSNPDRYGAWYNHKRILMDTVDKFQLGLSTLPGSSCKHLRLIVPVFESGNLVGIRGRAIDCSCDRWLNTAGSKPALFNGDLITNGQTIVIGENCIDTLLCMQESKNLISVSSTNGAATFREHWVEAIAKSKPNIVLVILDADFSGNGVNPKDYKNAVIEWNISNPKAKNIPASNGIKIVNELLKLKCKAVLYRWPAGTPLKFDMGSLLLSKMI